MNAKTATFALLSLGAVLLALVVFPPGPSAAPPSPAQTADDAGPATARGGSEADTVAGTRSESDPANKTGIKSKGAAPAQPGERTAGSGRDREKRLAALAARWALLPPAEALAKIGELPDQESRDTATLELLAEWSGQSSLEIIRRGDVWRFGAEGALAVYLMEEGKISAAQAAAMTAANTDGNRRGEMLARIGGRLASNDPAAAVALGNGLDGWQRQGFLEQLARDWADRSPDEARRWISAVNDAQTRDALLAGVLQAETQNNPAAAAAQFAAMPPSDGSARARAATRIASEWASKDTLAAMQWAQALPGDVERTAAQQAIGRVAPVGVGAMLNRNADGLPVVGGVVPGSPASASGALQSGDTVLAVSDANGSWVNTRGLPLRDLIGMVRGEPNTQVSLQVQSPGAAAPRVITLGRQQVIFRPSP